MAGRAGRAGEGGRVETREENAFDGVRALDGEARRAGETSKACICSNGVRHLDHVATVVVVLSVYTPSCLARWRPTTTCWPSTSTPSGDTLQHDGGYDRGAGTG